jgi:hypothetical protein
MKSCFVIQGYGRKTNYRDGRVLDLDASYAVIRDAVEAAGLRCIRADEIQHSGTIDRPMYEWLLKSDLVIADLSTYNENAVFELGVRYALRSSATLIVAEEQFHNPFDVSHIVIRRYKHLGDDIGAQEARRFRDELRAAIAAILAEPATDSPIYTFLPHLQPPQDRQAADAAALAELLPVPATDEPPAAPPAGSSGADAVDLTLSQLLGAAQQRLDANDHAGARPLLEEVRKRRPNDSYVVQRLALAVYKSRRPDPRQALLDAREVLRTMKPETGNNPETLALWAEIHRRLWEIGPAPDLLDTAVFAAARAFALKQDHATGVAFAYLLDLRARDALKAGRQDDAITDHTLAQRMRREAADYARAHLQRLPDGGSGPEHYALLASLWEVALGTGDEPRRAELEAQLLALPAPDWLREAWQWQGKKLRALLDEYAQLQRR